MVHLLSAKIVRLSFSCNTLFSGFLMPDGLLSFDYSAGCVVMFS